MSETVQPDSYIALHYRVANSDDIELVSTFGTGPATLQLGTGELAPMLERCVIGISPGQRVAAKATIRTIGNQMFDFSFTSGNHTGQSLADKLRVAAQPASRFHDSGA